MSCAGPECVLEHSLRRRLQFRSMLPLDATKHSVDSVVERSRPATIIALWKDAHRLPLVLYVIVCHWKRSYRIARCCYETQDENHQ